ncbi:hypothetical protein [Polyangium spumosum]|uniref:Uncharacterized protein n=1 Tax=Polyangium spumosum TaxID=889282 RepID=A0A6N7Q091_9BACT|nr:hypothetical protein [Polyangium spumosum]MRG94371.1 hypothetical protein [Polyangium spumosum]
MAIDTHMGDAGHDHAHGHDDEADHHDHSETDPSFVRDTQGRRWLAFIEGQGGTELVSEELTCDIVKE